MNNLIKSEWFRFWKTSKGMAIISVIISLVITLFFGNTNDGFISPISAFALSSGGMIGIFLITGVIAKSITNGYNNRTQLYEIMNGNTPASIILSRTAVYLSFFTVVYLVPAVIIYLFYDHSTELIKILALFVILYLRSVLTCIFLSPLLKESSFATIFIGVIFIMPVGVFDTPQAYSDSVFGLTGFGQLSLLANGITPEFTAKVIITSIISCIVCYLIGYFTLKKKYDLEPHPLY